MLIKIRALLLILTVTMASNCASAEISDVQLKSARVITELANDKEFDFVKFYVDGVTAGIRAANASALGRHSAIFCPPNELGISGDLLLALVRQAILKNKKAGDFSFEIVAMHEMETTFPCVAEKR